MKNKWLIVLLAGGIMAGGLYFYKNSDDELLEGNEQAEALEERPQSMKEREEEQETDDVDTPSRNASQEEDFTLFGDLLHTYEQAIIEQWGPDRLHDKGMGYGTGSSIEVSPEYRYFLYDVNKDGIPELLLGTIREDGTPEVNELYTMLNEEPTKLFTSDIRTNIEVYKDGTISESYGDRQLNYYRITESGGAEKVDGYEVDMGNGVYSRSVEPFEQLSDEDMREIEETYHKIGRVELEFEPIVQQKAERE